MATRIEPKLFLRSGFAISCFGHMVILTIGLIFAGANPFDTVPADAITVEIVSANEVGAGADNPGTAPTGGPETAPSSEPATDSAASASQPQPTPPSTPQATPPPQATSPPDRRTTRQASAPTQASPSPSSLTPWFQPPPEPPPSAEMRELNPADMFGMPLAMPDGKLGGSFDAPAIDKANVPNGDITAFHQHLRTCSKLPAGVSVTDNVRAVLRVFLKPDGTLAAPPQPIRIEGVSRGGGELYQSVVAALRKCQPFNMLPADKYEEWKVFDLSFTPQTFGGG
ncbi:MAG TPA: hypothetical protein VKT99_02185 [Xanthobacteraceae bacterium]|nr:hypothetical protein [Xanthobacteraceae bacterium]